MKKALNNIKRDATEMGRERKIEQQTNEHSNNEELTFDDLEQVAGGWAWHRGAAGRFHLGCAPTDEEMGLGAASILDR